MYSIKKKEKMDPLEKFDSSFLYFEISVMFERKVIIHGLGRWSHNSSAQRPSNITSYCIEM